MVDQVLSGLRSVSVPPLEATLAGGAVEGGCGESLAASPVRLIDGDVPACPNCRACGTDHLRQNAVVGKVSWSRLRPTTFGLIALGEWRDLGRIMSAEGIRAVLDALATLAPRALARREWPRLSAGPRTRIRPCLTTPVQGLRAIHRRGGHWFEPSTAHPMKALVNQGLRL
jgi:hypothetical protein